MSDEAIGQRKFARGRVGNAGVLVVTLVGLLSGCTAIPLSRLQPPFGSSAACEGSRRLLQSTAPETFVFVLPRAADVAQRKDVRTVGTSRGVATFGEFKDATRGARRYLPTDLQNDDVTNAFLSMMVKVSAEAQLAVARDMRIKGAEEQWSEVAAYPVPKRLTHRQVKQFADTFFDLQLRPTISAERRAQSGEDAFTTYFIEYYKGKFVDRLGQPIKKPQLPSTLSSVSIPVALTIPDADIATALTVLLEYLIDLFDPTPVMGDTDKVADKTKFFPGDPASKPTALVANLVEYRQIPADGCGVTIKNVAILAHLASAAADRAAALGGLVSGSAGGIGVSFGAFGKLSIGDNQTLGTIVKIAASRLAARATFAASYWALQGLPEAASARALGEGGAEEYLRFPR